MKLTAAQQRFVNKYSERPVPVIVDDPTETLPKIGASRFKAFDLTLAIVVALICLFTFTVAYWLFVPVTALLVSTWLSYPWWRFDA